MKYVRAGKTIEISVANLDGLPYYPLAGSAEEFWNNVSLDLSGGDTIRIFGTNPTVVGDPSAPPGFAKVTGFDIVIELPSDAQSGIRDLMIDNASNNAAPLILRNYVTVLPAGYKGAQIWFFHEYGYKFYDAAEQVYINRPGAYPDLDLTDTYDDPLPRWKKLVYDTYNSINSNTPRLYMYDCVADANKDRPLIDPQITGPNMAATAVNVPDLHLQRLVDTDTGEGDVRGYIDQDPNTGEWVPPSEILSNGADTTQQGNLPFAWHAPHLGAACAAPDEFCNGKYAIADDGILDPGKRPGTSINGPIYSTYRATMGFPDTIQAIDNIPVYRGKTPAATNSNWLIPVRSSNRKQYFYLTTAHWFFSREKIADQVSQCDPALWLDGTFIPGTINPGQYYTSYMLHQLQFIGLPLYYRTHNNAGGNPDFKLAQASDPSENRFEPFGGLVDQFVKSYWYHTNEYENESKSVLYITIDPVECILPGPRFADGPKNAVTYKRNHDSFTKKSKIKVWYQDLFAFSDQDKQFGVGVDPSLKHELSEPVLIMEAYCPRIDMDVDYYNWSSNDFVYKDLGGAQRKSIQGPSGTEEDDDKRGRFPECKFVSQPFEWTLVCDSIEKARSGKGNNGTVADTYDDGEKAFYVAQQLFAEFTGLKCRLNIHASYWPTDWIHAFAPFTPGVTPLSDHWCMKAGTYTKRDAAGPAQNGYYWDMYEGREGTFLCTSGNLEVVDDND